MVTDARKRFDFDVTTTGTVSVEAENARRAHDRLVAMIVGADATVATASSDGLVLSRLRVSADVVLVAMDGGDPVAGLAEALRAYRSRLDGA